MSESPRYKAQTLPEIIDTLRDALRGERDGAMRVPIVDLKTILVALERAERTQEALKVIAAGVLPGGDVKVLVPGHVQTFARAALEGES